MTLPRDPRIGLGPLQVNVPTRGGPDRFISLATTEPMGVQGAVVGPPCARCGRHVWVAPSSQELDLATFRVLCLDCAIAEEPAPPLAVVDEAGEVKGDG